MAEAIKISQTPKTLSKFRYYSTVTFYTFFSLSLKYFLNKNETMLFVKQK